MDSLTSIFIFMFGAAIGSFLNAVIWRLYKGESFMRGRSYCPHCKHTLAAHDLVPIVSYLMLRGHCRYCKARIGPQYLALEAAVGAVFVLVASRLAADGFVGANLARLLFHWYAVALLALIFVFDLRFMLILPTVALPGAVVAALANMALGDVSPLRVALGVLIGGGFFYLQYAVSKGRWIGGGDIYLGIFMGALLGVPGILVALFFSYVIGAVVSSALIAVRRKSMKSEVPFGTFLTIGTLIALLYGDRLVAAYLGAL